MNMLNLILPDLPFSAEQAMTRLCINIRFSGMSTRRILISSSFPDEGKSSVGIYLWKMLADSGEPTLLLDLDMRKSVISKRYITDIQHANAGIEHYLSGTADYQNVFYATNYPNAYLLPCLTCMNNPTLLFDDSRFTGLMDRLGQEFRHVIIDTPPLIDVADGSIIARRCDGAILVVRSGVATSKAVKQSARRLEEANCPLLGTVLNRVHTGNGHYGYSGYGYGYGYGYGTQGQ